MSINFIWWEFFSFICLKFRWKKRYVSTLCVPWSSTMDISLRIKQSIIHPTTFISSRTRSVGGWAHLGCGACQRRQALTGADFVQAGESTLLLSTSTAYLMAESTVDATLLRINLDVWSSEFQNFHQCVGIEGFG